MMSYILSYSSDAGSVILPGLNTISAAYQPDYEDVTRTSPGWQVAGAGDFNGDHKTDLLLRDVNGAVTDWLIGPSDETIVDVPNAPFVANDANALVQVGLAWHIVGTGDFNGDGRDDVLWQSDDGSVTDWLAQSNGAFVGNHLNINPGAEWQVVATGDFNGDGRDDILWRNRDGSVTDWIAQPDGTFVGNHLDINPGKSWHVVDVGDYNGDGRDDLLWQNDDGRVTDWLAQSDGTFAGNHLNITAPEGWHVVAPFVHDIAF